ncbi:hypothetical protein [Terasakiella pusilla]|uniref:hypothetical protein n=1 Tax=Terasakiella pusilla TaxID=64973 RepID=UPI003AA935EC
MTFEEEIRAEITKLKFQVNTLGQAIDHETNPIAKLIFEFDWDEKKLDAVYHCFEKAENIIENKPETFNHAMFEHLFAENVGVGYQGLKAIILSFYRECRYINVCIEYVKSLGDAPASEYRSIVKDIQEQEGFQSLRK